jgi:hypothetical protein
VRVSAQPADKNTPNVETVEPPCRELVSSLPLPFDITCNLGSTGRKLWLEVPAYSALSCCTPGVTIMAPLIEPPTSLEDPSPSYPKTWPGIPLPGTNPSISPTRTKQWTAITRILLELEQKEAVSSQGLSWFQRTNTTGKQRALDLGVKLQI